MRLIRRRTGDLRFLSRAVGAWRRAVAPLKGAVEACLGGEAGVQRQLQQRSAVAAVQSRRDILAAQSVDKVGKTYPQTIVKRARNVAFVGTEQRGETA